MMQKKECRKLVRIAFTLAAIFLAICIYEVTVGTVSTETLHSFSFALMLGILGVTGMGYIRHQEKHKGVPTVREYPKNAVVILFPAGAIGNDAVPQPQDTPDTTVKDGTTDVVPLFRPNQRLVDRIQIVEPPPRRRPN